MQPYSELANWDGSLEDMVDSLGPPSPSDSPSLAHDDLPMYDQYQQSNHQTNLSTAAAHISSSSSHFGPSPDAQSLFPSAAAQESTAVILSPQEREIMADITLDPDDEPEPEPSTSGGAASAAEIDAWAWAALALELEPAVKNGNEDASRGAAQPNNPQKSRSLVAPATTTTVPAPLAVGLGVASTSASVSPSPFAPPPASAPIVESVSQSLPPRSSSSSSTHLTNNAKSPDVVRVHPDQLAPSTDLDADEHPAGTEDVMEHTSASALHPEAGPGGKSTAGHIDAYKHDPPDQPQPRAPSRQSPALPPLDTTNHSSSSRSPPRRSPKTPLFLPSPSESLPPSHLQSDLLPPEESDSPDVISINSPSSSSPPPPLRRSRRRNTQIKTKTNKQGRQLMAHVLIPPLPSGARKSDYVPLEKLHHMREHRVAAMNKAPIGDNASSSALVAALQGAFENNSIGAGSTKTSGARRKRRKTKAVVPVEVVEVVDDADESEDVGELRNKGSSNLARALSSAFAHNSADPKVTAQPAAVAKGRTRQLRSTRAEVAGDSSANVEVILPPLPAKRSRPRLRTRVTSDADDGNTISSRLRNEKRQPQTPTSPQKKKRRCLVRRGDGDDVDEHEGEEEDGEIEIADRASRELPRRASRRTMPHTRTRTFSKGERSDRSQSKLTRTTKQRRTSTPSLAPISARTSLPSPLPSPPPEPPTASPSNTNSLAGLPLTILPAPAATDIVIPARALSHLHTPSGPPDPRFETGHQESVQGFHREEAAIGAHGLLESPVVAAISAVPTTTTTTANSIPPTVDSSIRANPTSLQNPPMNLDLDTIVPMDVTDGEHEQMHERQDAVQAAAIPPHALRISSSTHPDGPMLGFVLSEHDDARCTTSLSADTEASSDAIGLELGAKTTSDMEFMLLDSIDHNSALNADPGWVWHATAPSTGLVVESEFVGDGTIDPSVLGGAECSVPSLGGGSPNKAVFRSDDYIRGSLFMRARDSDKSLDNYHDEDSDDLGDEGDVMGLLFENSTDGGTVSRPPSAHGAGGKGKNKDTATVDGTDARQIDTVINPRAGSTRKRRKSWRKTLADENDNTDHCMDTDTESHSTVARPCLSNVSNNLASSVTATFCHHCRRKTFRPKMCCTRINESTGKQCRKRFCDLCIQKRYPSLTFDEFATSFSCPYCESFCNCTQCARRRGETYIPERDGGWRRWAALLPVAAAAAASGPTSPSQNEASRDVVDLSEPGRNRIEPATIVPLPQPHSTSNTLISSPHLHVYPIPTTSKAATKSVVDKKSRGHMYIGKWQKSWGRPVSVPDPDPGFGRNGRKRKRAVRTFVGSKAPLLWNKKRANKMARKNPKRRRGRKKGLEMEKNEQRQIAPSLPPSRSPSIAAGNEDGDGANQNAALYEEHDPDPDADADINKGDWPGEYNHAHAHDDHITVVPPGVTVSGVVATTISPEELERAIGAAFAAGMRL